MAGDGGICGCIEIEVGWQSAVAVAVAWSIGVEDVKKKVPRFEANHDVCCGLLRALSVVAG